MAQQDSHRVPISVLIPTKNDASNLDRCLAAIDGWAGEVVVVDSRSADATTAIATGYGAKVLQFDYRGGWPKKRQWALDNHNFQHDWILLLDTDEILEDPIKREIETALSNPRYDGYWIRFRIIFLGRMLRFGDTQLWKLSLFRAGKGRYEQRLANQDQSMADMEIHEHVVVDGPTAQLKHSVRHENINSLSRYIEKHNEYSNWEAKVLLEGQKSDIQPRLFGSQTQRRRWLKRTFWKLPGFPLIVFLYVYLFRGGVLDGRAGFYYAAFRGVQYFHTKAKVYEQHRKTAPVNEPARRAA